VCAQKITNLALDHQAFPGCSYAIPNRAYGAPARTLDQHSVTVAIQRGPIRAVLGRRDGAAPHIDRDERWLYFVAFPFAYEMQFSSSRTSFALVPCLSSSLSFHVATLMA